MVEKKPQEVVSKNMATKAIYHYIDSKLGIDVKSKEVFKKLFITRLIQEVAYQNTGH